MDWRSTTDRLHKGITYERCISSGIPSNLLVFVSATDVKLSVAVPRAIADFKLPKGMRLLTREKAVFRKSGKLNWFFRNQRGSKNRAANDKVIHAAALTDFMASYWTSSTCRSGSQGISTIPLATQNRAFNTTLTDRDSIGWKWVSATPCAASPFSRDV